MVHLYVMVLCAFDISILLEKSSSNYHEVMHVMISHPVKAYACKVCCFLPFSSTGCPIVLIFSAQLLLFVEVKCLQHLPVIPSTRDGPFVLTYCFLPASCTLVLCELNVLIIPFFTVASI